MIGVTFQATTSKFDSCMKTLTDGFTPQEQQIVYDAMALKFLELVTAPGELGTPIDTGRARSGWARALDELGGHFRHVGSDWAESEAGRVLGDTGVEQTKHAAVRWILNGVNYVIWLEYGSSDQAPAGFIRVNLERLRGEFRDDALAALKKKLAEANAAARTTGLKWVTV